MSAELKIVHYPHPTLRFKSQNIVRFDAQLRELIGQMFELMYEANGVGLAANQVDLPLRLFVANLEAKPDAGEEMVFINPVISRPKGTEEREEGCLSLPGLHGDVIRPKQVHVKAYNLQGQVVEGTVDGLMARVIQHELDHLDGVLFTDRMSQLGKLEIAPLLSEFESVFYGERDIGKVPEDEVIESQRQQWLSTYCQ